MVKGLRLIVVVGLLVLVGCKKEVYDNPVPDAVVSLKINLGTGDYVNFNSPGMYRTFVRGESYVGQSATDALGYGGLLVYIDMSGNYTAYDLSCPVEVKRNVLIHPIDAGEGESTMFFQCDSCGEKYDLSSGFGLPTQGICKYGLKQYKVAKNYAISGTILYIYAN